jgi:hypothetical protein
MHYQILTLNHWSHDCCSSVVLLFQPSTWSRWRQVVAVDYGEHIMQGLERIRRVGGAMHQGANNASLLHSPGAISLPGNSGFCNPLRPGSRRYVPNFQLCACRFACFRHEAPPHWPQWRILEIPDANPLLSQSGRSTNMNMYSETLARTLSSWLG